MSSVSYSEIKDIIGNNNNLDIDTSFKIFRYFEKNKNNHKYTVQDLLIRCLDRIEIFPNIVQNIIYDYVEDLGLFPYLEIDGDVSLKKALHYEFYRSENLPDIVMHRKQAEIYDKIMSGKSIILSAPTSFGKSLLIEEIIASNEFKNIAIVLPTLALVDEIRHKLKKYSDVYKLIFSTKQSIESQNVLILTPERLVELPSLPNIDFFIIDEFYKISNNFENDERVNVLNHAFYKLLKMTKRFYMLGPNIKSIPNEFVEDFECEFINSNFSTVAYDEIYIKKNKEKGFSQLADLLFSLKKPTLIYCQSPVKAEEYTKKFITNCDENNQINEHTDVIGWIKKNIHPKWTLAKSLKYGVAFHHGRIPRYLGRYIVNQFNQGNIKYLFCTSTLIEGINTAAENVVIYNKRKGRKNINFFDYSNIKGRSGRMNRYFIGKVYNFYEPPEKSDVYVDFPWYTQDKATDEILIQMEDEDLKPSSKKKLHNYKYQDILDLETIKSNNNVTISGQIALAKEIIEKIEYYKPLLIWSGLPTYRQLKETCILIWDYLVETNGQLQEVCSGKQLAFFVSLYSRKKSVAGFINELLRKDNNLDTADEAVQKAMAIVRSWFGFRFPKLLLALEQIQESVFTRRKIKAGDYKYYASLIEFGFCHPVLASLEEFGIPISIAKKIRPFLVLEKDKENLDDVIFQIKLLKIEHINFDPFELKLLREFIENQ